MAVKKTKSAPKAKLGAKNKAPKAPKRVNIPPKILKYLESAGVRHEILEHKTVYTALDAAATLKKKLGEIAKSLLVKADQDYYLVLLPADQNLDLAKLQKAIGRSRQKEVKTLKIPGEKIVTEALRIKAGAISAFGKLHKLATIAEKKLAQNKKAVFSAGTPNYSVEMAVQDFLKLEDAALASFGIKRPKRTVRVSTAKSPKRKRTVRVSTAKSPKKRKTSK